MDSQSTHVDESLIHGCGDEFGFAGVWVHVVAGLRVDDARHDGLLQRDLAAIARVHHRLDDERLVHFPVESQIANFYLV